MKTYFVVLSLLLSAIAFVFVFFIDDYIVQFMLFVPLAIYNLIVLSVILAAKPLRRYKWWAIGTVLFQVLLFAAVWVGSRVYTRSFKEKSDKDILFEVTTQWPGSSLTTREITTVYPDGTAYVMSHVTDDHAPFWASEECDSTTVRWVAMADHEIPDRDVFDDLCVRFDLKDKSFSTNETWGTVKIDHIDWNRLYGIGSQLAEDSEHLLFAFVRNDSDSVIFLNEGT